MSDARWRRSPDRRPILDLVATIVRRAVGNPFFTEELLAAGATEAGDQLPDSLRDVLLVRVHALSELAQEVIGCAAVVGPTFDHDLLLRACDLDEASVSMALREANAAQLIVVSDADGTYAFRHALLQEAIYDDMLPRDRRRCHARCAEGLAARPVPDGAEGASQLAALAHHAYGGARPAARPPRLGRGRSRERTGECPVGGGRGLRSGAGHVGCRAG